MKHPIYTTLLVFTLAFAPLLLSAETSAQTAPTLTLRVAHKDAKFRTVRAARALEHRVHQRLVAARFPNHRTEISVRHGEVIVHLYDTDDRALAETILTARGGLIVAPMAYDVPHVEDLAELCGPSITPVFGMYRERRDTHFVAENHASLQAFTKGVSLATHSLHVGEDKTGKVRTYFTAFGEPKLSEKGMGVVAMREGRHPNYAYVTLYWEGKTSGVARMLTLLRAARKTRPLMVIVDGQVEGFITSIPETEGRLTLTFPEGTRAQQQTRARKVAGILASEPHPNPVVVVHGVTTR